MTAAEALERAEAILTEVWSGWHGPRQPAEKRALDLAATLIMFAVALEARDGAK